MSQAITLAWADRKCATVRSTCGDICCRGEAVQPPEGVLGDVLQGEAGLALGPVLNGGGKDTGGLHGNSGCAVNDALWTRRSDGVSPVAWYAASSAKSRSLRSAVRSHSRHLQYRGRSIGRSTSQGAWRMYAAQKV